MPVLYSDNHTGKNETVKLRCTNGCRHDLMVKFGKDILIRDDGDEHFIANINVTKNEGFYQWLAAYGPHIVIESPTEMRQHYMEYLKQCHLVNA